jgi:Putative Flp pilus-assembly TadE/G-like
MKGFGRSLIQILKQDSGQILYLAAPLCIVFLGMAGLTIDVGNAYVAYRELQASTDAAALAGAYALVQSGATTTSVSNMISSYSSVSGQKNASVNLPGAAVTTTFRCVSDAPALVSAPCAASSTGYNVVQVMQTAQVPTIFISALNVFQVNHASTSITLRDYATATMMSGFDKQLNVAIVVDTTNSMGQNDSACGTTKIKCALGGVQTLLKMMQPCSLGSTSSTCKSAYDQVSLFTFPPIQANTASDDTVCPSSNPTIVPYFAPAEGGTWSNPSGSTGSYQVTLQPTSGSSDTNDGFFDNYSSTNAANGGINTSSALSVAAGASSCQGMQTPGGDGTYIASSIFAAQSALTAAQANNPGSQNVMIVLSDGDASTTSSKSSFPSCTGSSPPSPCISGKDSTGLTVSYPSVNQQCHQSILAANYATAQGTTVYTVSYGSPSSGCADDTGSFAITPCSELQQMSSGYSSGNTSHFFADSTSACGGSETLNEIFGQIGGQLTSARLIPNGTT